MGVKGEPDIQSSPITSQDLSAQNSRPLNDNNLEDLDLLIPNEGDRVANDSGLRELSDEPTIRGAESYKGFQKMTTIPAASLSIFVSFIMIASVRKIWRFFNLYYNKWGTYYFWTNSHSDNNNNYIVLSIIGLCYSHVV